MLLRTTLELPTIMKKPSMRCSSVALALLVKIPSEGLAAPVSALAYIISDPSQLPRGPRTGGVCCQGEVFKAFAKITHGMITNLGFEMTKLSPQRN